MPRKIMRKKRGGRRVRSRFGKRKGKRMPGRTTAIMRPLGSGFADRCFVKLKYSEWVNRPGIGSPAFTFIPYCLSNPYYCNYSPALALGASTYFRVYEYVMVRAAKVTFKFTITNNSDDMSGINVNAIVAMVPQTSNTSYSGGAPTLLKMPRLKWKIVNTYKGGTTLSSSMTVKELWGLDKLLNTDRIYPVVTNTSSPAVNDSCMGLYIFSLDGSTNINLQGYIEIDYMCEYFGRFNAATI
nr:MAG: capsid protein [Cressdnaviricota sp.]